MYKLKKYCYIENIKANKKNEFKTMKNTFQLSFFDEENKLNKLTKKEVR